MKVLFRYVAFGAAVVSVSCGDGGISTPVQPSVTGPVAVTGLTSSPERRRIPLGQPAHSRLDTGVYSGQLYCEVGNDPVPCERFSVDVPRRGTLTISVEFDGPGPMFVELGNLAVEHLGFVMGESPLAISTSVAPGVFLFRVGVYAPWGRPGHIDFRVLATMP